jgi:alkanesulfonate monooxygenase SsuD/methylene tetrahydromethanopterin reductase-like flavin-dependent oxidoreductase (luciferase family)
MARTVDHISGGRLVLGIGAGWYEKDYTTYGYEFGSWKSRFDLFDAGLERIEARLDQLIPPPVRKIPMLIGGTGPKRTLPAVARHADIWHTFLSVEAFTEASTRVDDLALARGTLWTRHRTLGALVRRAQRRGLPRRGRHHVHHRDRPRRHHWLRLRHPGGNAGLA